MNESKDMMDRTPDRRYLERMDGIYKIYSCASCGWILARVEVAMEEDGINSKLRAHSCRGLPKKDFEREVS